MIGERLGTYTITELLGAGGMGVVYRAYDDRLERDVAIKVIAPEAAANEQARARLLREARTASALNHPHVCTIHDVQADGDRLFIVMEYVAGVTLRALARPAGLAMKDFVHFGIQIADALEHAHQRGIVHRDLKSANIVVSADRRVKVLDFGLAKHFGREEDETQPSLTHPEVLIGTVAYMAPELFRREPAGPASDVWALGVVLYEMVTGRLPFTGASSVAIASAILEHQPAPLAIDLPADLEATILRCLRKDPRERWQRPGEVKLALELDRPPASRTTRTRQRSVAAKPRNRAISSLVVLPLQNLSEDPSQEFLADGLTEACITTLAKISALRVISRTSAMQYKGRRVPLRQIAKELKIHAVVEGSVLRSADTIRISVQLVDARTDTTLWAENYDRQFSDVLAIHNEIAQAIAREVQATLTGDERRDFARDSPVDADAFEEFLKGRYFLNRRSAADLRSAMQHFQRAIERDASFGPAHVGLADCYILLVSYGLLAPRQGMPLAKRLVAKALELDPSLVAAYTSSAMASFSFDWQVDQAEQHFQRAIRLNPNYAMTHQWYAVTLSACGRYQEALASLANARELDPLSVPIRALTAWVHYHGRDYDLALRACRHALDLQPNFHQALVFQGMAYERKGMLDEALASLETAVGIAGRDEIGSLTLAYVYARAGAKDRARAILDRIVDPQRYVNSFSVAAVCVALDDIDQAWRWLTTGFEERGFHMTSLGVDPRFAALRGDPRMTELVRKIGVYNDDTGSISI
jgi:serine/threonine protein kinase/tetratricopeptide (TPR) repeat protein